MKGRPRSRPIRSAARYNPSCRRVKREASSPGPPWRRGLMAIGLAAIAICGACATLVAYHRLGRSDFFAVTAVTIQGCRHVTKDDVRTMAAVDGHTNLLSVKTAAIERTLEADPWIKKATVERDWPDRLVITVREKQPVALLNQNKGLFFLTADGQVIAPAALPDDIDFPVITGLDHGQSERQSELLRQALHFLSYTDHGNRILNRQAVSEIHVTQKGEMVLYLLDPTFPIYLGDGNDLYTKYKRLVSVLQNLHSNGEFRDIARIRMQYGNNEILVGKTTQTQSG